MSIIKREQIQGSDNLDHLGLVAATIDKLGFIAMIDERLPVDKNKGAKTTMGQRVAAMVLNGLGFIDDRLYMFPKFLANKPVEQLLGSGITAADFNDDALGRCLDKIYEYGTTKMFSELALSIGIKHKMLGRKTKIDTTTLTVYGEYEEEDETSVRIDSKSNVDPEVKENKAERSVLEYPDKAVPKRGYAKNHRHDLKQMTLLLATTGKSGFPIWMESQNGNASDQKTMQEAAQRIQKLCNALKVAPAFLHVGDSAMYLSCVKHGENLLWLSRVPESITQAKELIKRTDIHWQQQNDDYNIYEIEQCYKNVPQRWLLVFSKLAYKKEMLTLNKNIDKEFMELEKTLWHISAKEFGCEQDAKQTIAAMQKTNKYHDITATISSVDKFNSKGRPKKDSTPDKIGYKVTATITKNTDKITQAELTKGKFILATNQLDKKELTTPEILPAYKELSSTESGFKFIKDDTFELDSIFLKKTERINALMMIMTICLMVYSFAQYMLRQQLVQRKETLPLQTGRLSDNPTMKWIYRMLLGVHVLKINLGSEIQRITLNLNDLLCRIIRYFGEVACRIYGISLNEEITVT